MSDLKITSWNVENLDRLLGEDLTANRRKRRDAVVTEIRDLAPDILCLIEGPKGEAAIDTVAEELLGGEYVPVKAGDGEYDIKGSQWMWFLVRPSLKEKVELLPPATWDALSDGKWDVHYWGIDKKARHEHYRHPQVLILQWEGARIEFIGLHLKSKFVNRGRSMWKAGGKKRSKYVYEAIKARIKLATEAANVRKYIDAKFAQTEKPAIFLMGDLNDGPGKELFEREYLFFDLVANLQGEVFFAQKFLNHALFDYPQHLRWSVHFKDFVDPERDPQILLDHILFTQALVDGSAPLQVAPHAGLVEHEVHDLINATLTSKQKTSDHKPISVALTAAAT